MKIKVRKYRAVLVNCEGLVEEKEGAYYGTKLKAEVKSAYKNAGYNVLLVKPLERGYKEINGIGKFYEVDECVFKEDEIDE